MMEKIIEEIDKNLKILNGRKSALEKLVDEDIPAETKRISHEILLITRGEIITNVNLRDWIVGDKCGEKKRDN